MKNSKYCMYLRTPASWEGDLWKDALPAGNGKVGIAVYGAVKDETILVNHGNLWHWGVRSKVPDVTEAFQKTREFISKQEYHAANDLIADALREKGYQAKLYSPCPLGDIKIHMDTDAPFHNYYRYVDMETGETGVEWQTGESKICRKAFVSRTRDIIFLKVAGNHKDLGMHTALTLHDTYHEDTKRMRMETEVSVFEESGYLIYQVKDGEGQIFGMAAVVVECDGKYKIDADGIHVGQASDFTIAVKVYGTMDPVRDYQMAVKSLEGLDGDYEAYRQEHVRVHEALFHTSEIDMTNGQSEWKCNEALLFDAYTDQMSNEMCEKLWNYGRYLFISGTDENQLPYAMYGLWGGRYQLLWSHNMANINIQMMYWQCGCSGYIQFLKAFIRYYFDLIPDFRENAKQIYGLNGICMAAGTTPGYGVMNQVVPVIADWIGGCGWAAQHMYEYYLYTGDEKLLEEQILPFMLESALFYEEFLTKQEGVYQIMPSVSPENTPVNYGRNLHHMQHGNPVTRNAVLDIAIIKELLRNLLELSKNREGLNTKEHLWKDIIAHLPEYVLNEDKAVKEWSAPELEDRYCHRHLSHIYPVFPGREIGEESPLWEGFIKAVDLREMGAMSGWSQAQAACIYDRLHRGDAAWNCLNNLSRSCLTKSFLTLHNDWRNMGMTLDLYGWDEEDDKAPVQLDASAGFVCAVQMMVFYERKGTLSLLPALPKQWRKGSIKRFGFTGGTVSMRWDYDVLSLECTIISKKAQTLNIKLPPSYCGKYLRSERIQKAQRQEAKENLLYKGQIEIELQAEEVWKWKI